MAFITSDFLKETSTTTGTGNITLGGVRVPGSTFASAMANGSTFHYAISHDTLGEWETGLGTMLTSTTFSRSVISSSNANALVNFSGGSKRVDVVLPASRIVSLAGPLFFNGVSASSGNLSFDNAGGVSFGIAGNVVTAAAPGFTGLTTNDAFQLISRQTMAAAMILSLTNATNSTLSATRFVLHAGESSASSALSQGNVAFFMSGSSVAAAAWLGVVAGVGGGLGQHVSFSNANAVSWGGGTTTAGGIFAGAQVFVTAVVPRIRQAQVSGFAGLVSLSITNATDTVISNTSAATMFFQASTGIFGASRLSTINVAWAMSSQSMIGVAWMNMRAGTLVANDHNLSFSDANGVSFGLDTVTTATFGRIAVLTASFSPVLGVVSHVGGNAVSSVSLLAFSNASNVTFSLSTAANAATVFASVAAGGGGGITAFALSNAASSVMATGLTYSNANGFSFLLSTAAGNAATLSGSYTVPSIAGLISAFALTNAASSVAATRLELSNANGFSFLLSTGASVGTLSGSFSSLSFSNLNGVTFGIAGSTLTASARPDIGVVSHIGGNVASSVTQLAFSNASNVTFSLSTAANAATVIASVAAAGGLTYSGLTPFAEGVIVATTMPNNNFMVAPLGAMPAWQFDRVILGGSFSHASNSTCQNTLNVGYGLYTRNGSSLSLVHSNTTSYAFTGSGTVGNYSLFSNFRQFSIARTATMAASNYWVAVGWSLSTSSQAAMTAGLGMISQNFSVNIGFMNVSAPVSQQLDIGRGIVSSTTWQPPDAIAINAITGSGVTGWRAPFIQFASGSF